MRFGRLLGVWAMIAGLLFWNGILVLGIFVPFLGREAGEMMGVFIAMIIIMRASRPFIVSEREMAGATAVRIGILWGVLTVLFEIGLCRLAMIAGAPVMPRYGMWDGPFWPLIVLSIAVAPLQWLRREHVHFEVTK
jgi:hypothetical protein